MSTVSRYLDCGCAIMTNGDHELCPTCSGNSTLTLDEYVAKVAILEAALKTAKEALAVAEARLARFKAIEDKQREVASRGIC